MLDLFCVARSRTATRPESHPPLLSLAAFALLALPAAAFAASASRSVELECMRTTDAAALLPEAKLADPDADLSACRPSRRELACAPASGESGVTALPEHGRLLDYDRVCTSARCGGAVRKSMVRLFQQGSVQERQLALSCALIEEPDDDVMPAPAQADSHATTVTCGDFTGDGNHSASDALGTLRSAVGSATCLICVCDVDNNGNISATDALRTLRFAVGQPIALLCPADGSPIAWDAGGDAVNWTDPLNWSLDRIPNGCDDATIATGSVQVNSGNNSVRSITSSVPLDFNGGKLTVRDSVTASGLTRMKGGTLARADVLVPGNDAPLVMTTNPGTLEQVHVSADMDMTASSASVNIAGGLTLDGVATMGTNSQMLFPVSTTVALNGTGSVLMQHSNAYLYNYGGTNLIIGEDMLIHGSGGNIGGNQANTGMTLDGTIDSDGGGTLDVGPPSGVWTSGGLLRASNGTLRLQGSWSNTGTLEIEPTGTMNLGGSFASATFGTFDRSGGTVNITGAFDVSTPFTLNAATGDWRLLGGTIKNGTLNGTDNAKIIFTTSAGTLNDLVMNADMDMTASSSNANVTNGLTLNATATMGTNSQLLFPVSPEVTLDGTGDVLMQHSNAYIYNYAGTNLLIGPDMLIHGSGGNVGGNQASTQMTVQGTIDSDGGGALDVGPPSGTWSNSGLLRASNGTLRLQGAWTNTGTIAIEPAGTLNLGGAFSSSTFGTFDRDGGTVNLTGAFDLATPFTLNAGTGSWRLIGGTIKNGTLNAADGAKLIFTTSGGTLTNLVMNADMDMTASSASVNSTNGLTLNGIATLGTNAQLLFPVSAETTLDGSGEVLMQHSNAYLYNYGGTNLLIGPDMLIHGSGGNIGGNQAGTQMTVQGTIDSDGGGALDVGPPSGTWSSSGLLRASNGTLRLQGTWTNTGTIAVEMAGTLNLGGAFSSTGFGTFDRDGGTVNVTGAFDLTQPFTLNASTGNWRLVGGTIKNGTLNAADGGKIIATTSAGTLSNLVMNADLDMTASSASANVTNGLTLNGIATLGTNAQLLFPVSSETTLDGSGEVLMQHSNAYLYNYGGTNLLIGADMLIHGSGGNIGGNQAGTQMTVQGTIDSDGGGSLDVGPPSGTWSSSGLLRASNGTLRLQGTWTNAGTIAVETTGTLNLGGAFSSSTFGTFDRDGGTVNVTGTFTLATPFQLNAGTGDWLLAGGTIKDGTLNSASGAKLIFTTSTGTLNNLVMNANMDMTASSASANVLNGLTLNGVATLGTNAQLLFPVSSETVLDGTGEVLMQHSNAYLYNYGGTNLLIGADMLIHGSGGNVGGNQANTQMTVQGTIDSDAAGSIDVGPLSGTWTNSGTLNASTGNLRTQGSWTNSGLVHVGTGRTFSALSGFTQGASGQLAVDIAGTAATAFGKVTVTGAATLAGTLTIALTNAFIPSLGNTFQIMTFTSSTGMFTTINGLDIPGPNKFALTTNATNVTLTVVAD